MSSSKYMPADGGTARTRSCSCKASKHASLRPLNLRRIACSISRPFCKACRAASWINSETPKLMTDIISVAAAVASGGPDSHPSLKPVMAKLFDIEPITIVRSRICGKELTDTWRPFHTIESYTSSEISQRSCRIAISAICSSDCRE